MMFSGHTVSTYILSVSQVRQGCDMCLGGIIGQHTTDSVLVIKIITLEKLNCKIYSPDNPSEPKLSLEWGLQL